MDKTEILVTVISAVLASNVLAGIISHFLYNNKLNKELRAKRNSHISDKIVEALSKYRDMELMLITGGIYDINAVIEEKGSKVDFFKDDVVFYPAIFSNWESFDSFFREVENCRKEYEHYLPCKLALNLVFIEKYLIMAKMYVDERGGEKLLPLFGLFFAIDLERWQIKVDKLLVKEINRCSWKLESHRTKAWEKFRKTEVIEPWKRTLLNYFKGGDIDKRDEEVLKMAKAHLELEITRLIESENN